MTTTEWAIPEEAAGRFAEEVVKICELESSGDCDLSEAYRHIKQLWESATSINKSNG